ncbi:MULTISPECIES: ABC transporter permease [Roseivirga]|jgi:putative ABC transport system permease protein|uniref:ABC transporter permease n=1 Tax=Roseivirga thermotolerans TaxID=1758176 RepID=A0ABQ3I7G8_9BACT|nr:MULTISPECIES: ABC transporter permease [Roseivirga]MEC7756084.1 ABC transporter permease [Bacteroidota bacterium]GHE62045.1 ABC transporter permease [Roseivirga thermotolerans]|tara:strand:+ start:6049 stop:7284 length:1236 start_codon:yes stop_codon:yes gene_type:complete
MNLRQNISEGISSIKANILRTVLTGLIIAIGITSLVGMLTAVDGIKSEIDASLSNLGANSFDINSRFSGRRNQNGRKEKSYEPIRFTEANRFKETFEFPSTTTVYTRVSGIAEIKYGSKTTNPNISVTGGDENYIAIKGINIERGRNFSSLEIQYGNYVCILGTEVVKALFEANEDPLNQQVKFYGNNYRVIGILEEKGGFGGDTEEDRNIIIPLQNAKRLDRRGSMRFNITTMIQNPEDIEYAMGEATGLMRQIRGDRIGEEDSFEVERSDSVTEALDNITNGMRMAGFGIGAVTLLGAAIGLMNIMMVSVTERTREIGIRKALGATPKRILQQFLIESVVICQMGGIAGAVLGIIVGNILAKLLGGAFIIPWLWITVGLIICVVVGVISGYIPAKRAAAMDPIESLRFE